MFKNYQRLSLKFSNKHIVFKENDTSCIFVGSPGPKKSRGVSSAGGEFPTLGEGFPTLGKGFPTLGGRFPTLGRGFPTLGPGVFFFAFFEIFWLM